MTRIIIVGAGVIGASIAHRLAAAGCAVTLLERDRIGGGTSGASFAWINANEKTPRSYYEINRLGMQAHADLGREFGTRAWYHGGGALEWRTDEAEAAELRERVARLRDWGYAAEWISPTRLRELEPALKPGSLEGAEVAFFPDEGWADAVTLAGFLLSKARDHGALFRRAVVTGITLHGSRVSGVTTEAGETLDADLVVNCTGRWASDVHQHDRLRFPLAPTIGLLVVTGPNASGVRRMIRASGCHFRPDGGSRLMLHSEHDEKQFRPDSPASETYPVAKQMIGRAARLYPDIGDVEPEGMRLALRAIPGDGLSAIGPVPGVTGYYAAVTHSGVVLAPWIGKAVTQEVVDGKRVGALDDFRPDRFFTDQRPA